jgi:hypothetical protein
MNFFDSHREIINDGLNLIWSQTKFGELTPEVLEPGIKEESLVIGLEDLLSNEFFMPPGPLFMNKNGILNGFLLYFIQLIQLCHPFLLSL